MKVTLAFHDLSLDKMVRGQFGARDVSNQNANTAFLRLFNNYVQALFDYGMQLGAEEQTVKFCIQVFFIDVKENKLSPPAHSTKNKLYKQFRDILSREMLWTKKLPSIPVSGNVTSNLARLKTEATFLRVRCGFNYKEISAIMAINQESVYNLVYQSIINANDKKDNILGND